MQANQERAKRSHNTSPASCNTLFGRAERLRCSADPRVDPTQNGGEFLRRHLGVVGRLGTKPVAVGQSEETTQGRIGVRRNRSCSCNDFADALGRHSYLFGQTILRELHRKEEFPSSNSPGVTGVRVAMISLSLVVVHDLDVGARMRITKQRTARMRPIDYCRAPILLAAPMKLCRYSGLPLGSGTRTNTAGVVSPGKVKANRFVPTFVTGASKSRPGPSSTVVG